MMQIACYLNQSSQWKNRKFVYSYRDTPYIHVLEVEMELLVVKWFFSDYSTAVDQDFAIEGPSLIGFHNQIYGLWMW